MYSRRHKSNVIRSLLAALILTLIAPFAPTAHADFYNPAPLNMASGPNYNYFDFSASGSVIAVADGCYGCYSYYDPGAAYLSTNSGASFQKITSIPEQYWVEAQISSDASTIAYISRNNFYASTNSGASFSRVDALPLSYQSAGDYIFSAALSNDGQKLFLYIENGMILKYLYNSSQRRWNLDFQIEVINGGECRIATNANGSKTYVVCGRDSIKVLSGTSLSVLPNTRRDGNNDDYFWDDIRTSDSGNEVMALGGTAYMVKTVFKSFNAGASFTPITSINNVNLNSVTAMDISADGNASFIATEEPTIGVSATTFYTQHGKTSPWYQREESYNWIHRVLRSNADGSIIGTYTDGLAIRIYRGAPDAPSITSLTVASTSSISLNWAYGYTNATDEGAAITDVIIEYATSQSGPWSVFNDGVAGGNLGSTTVTGLSGRNTYYFRTKAKNSYGTSDPSSSTSIFLPATPSAPPAPTYYDAQKSVINLGFGTPSDLGGASSVTDEEWQYSIDSGTTWNSSSNPPFRVTNGYLTENGVYRGYVYIFSEHTAGVPLTIRTRSSNGTFWSPWSAGTTATIYQTPSAPTNFQLNNVFTSTTMTWNPPSYLGGQTIVDYEYSYKPSNQSTWFAAYTSSTTATITGLTGGANYDYRVAARTNLGQKSQTAERYQNLTANPPTKLSINRGSQAIRSGAAFGTQPKISFFDQTNSLVTGVNGLIVTAEVNKGGILIGAESATSTSGIATFTNLGLRGVAGTQYTITYRSGDLTPVSETLTLTAGTKSAMRFVRKTVGGVNGVVFPTQAQIEVVDGDGNRVTSDDTTTVVLNTNTGFLWDGLNSSPETRTVSGLATFANVHIKGPNGYAAALTYSSTGLPSIQETITVSTGAAATFTRTTRAMDAYIGGKFGTQPVYQVLDSFGNIVSSGEYFITITPSQGTLTGRTTVTTVNGVATFTDLGLTGVNASQLVILSVSSPGFTTYTGDSVVTVAGYPRLAWNDLYIPRGTAPFQIPVPESNTSGTFTYSSSNPSVISISGSTVTVGNAGTATITATFTPSNTNNYRTGETVTALFTVNPSAGTLIVSAASGSLQKGIRNNITATASDAGTITFYANGKKIAGCIQLKTVNSVATCSWKPSIQGGVSLTALLVPTNEALSVVRATSVSYTVVRRSGRR